MIELLMYAVGISLGVFILLGVWFLIGILLYAIYSVLTGKI